MEIFNPPPPSVCFLTLDTRSRGTKLGQLWMEDGLSGDIAGGVEMILVTPGLPCTTAPVCVRGTKFFVPLTSLLFVCPPIGTKTKVAVFTATKRSFFSGLLNSLFQSHLSIAWWRLCPPGKEGRTRDCREGAVRCGWKQRSPQIRFPSVQRGLFYWENSLWAALFSSWSTGSGAADVSSQTALALQSTRCLPLSHFSPCLY